MRYTPQWTRLSPRQPHLMHLFKGYVDALGIVLEDENGEPYSGIDFSVTAEIRDKVIKIIESSGIVVMPEYQEF